MTRLQQVPTLGQQKRNKLYTVPARRRSERWYKDNQRPKGCVWRFLSRWWKFHLMSVWGGTLLRDSRPCAICKQDSMGRWTDCRWLLTGCLQGVCVITWQNMQPSWFIWRPTIGGGSEKRKIVRPAPCHVHTHRLRPWKRLALIQRCLLPTLKLLMHNLESILIMLLMGCLKRENKYPKSKSLILD